MRIRHSRLFQSLLLFGLLLSSAAPLRADDRGLPADARWQAIHREAHAALYEISLQTFRTTARPDASTGPPQLNSDSIPRPWLIVVGFTGGLEGKDSSASGMVVLRDQVERHMGERHEVLALTFSNFHWRRAATEIEEVVNYLRGQAGTPLPQPLIVVYGHSWGGGSIAKFARELRKQDLEISLAIYIDAFTLRNPRLPDNIRYAVNFYQRSGILYGLPFRGKRQLLPEDPGQTRILGSYRIRPVTEKWGWSWNLLQPLLYRHHHRIGHDLRLQQYLLEIVNLKLQLLDQAAEAAVPERQTLFDQVVILGASVSAEEKAPSPGRLLARHAGAPPERIHVFARGGATSREHLGYLDNIARLRPSVIFALDLFYHDFKASLFLTESRKQYLRDYIQRLHDTGAVVVVGNIPSLVLLRHGHVNRYLAQLAEEFPNLLLVDAEGLLDDVEENGLNVEVEGKPAVLRRNALFADRVHLNLLGSTAMANLMMRDLLARFRALWPAAAPLTALPLDGLLRKPGLGAAAAEPAAAPR